MKVYITQGHERGIGLEVFFKSTVLLPQEDVRSLKLIAFRESVQETLETLRIPFGLGEEEILLPGLSLSTCWLHEVQHSESFTALQLGMRLSEGGGVLMTLPTSKDQFPEGHAGHTEYFRHFYRLPELGMFFSSPALQVLLLSDHVPIKDLSDSMTEELILQRLTAALKTLTRWEWPIGKVLVSGLNPHAGESGLIGHEDERIQRAVARLRGKKFDIAGPYPGDTMFLEQTSSEDILVYLFHDQGLGVFKGIQGFIGANITLGLPYPRVSPDHGTSFNLYGKNMADYRGCSFALNEALKLVKKVSYGKNSSHQGQSS